jgi:monofunctional biosynthetic peptidoglycan transglycosylase
MEHESPEPRPPEAETGAPAVSPPKNRKRLRTALLAILAAVVLWAAWKLLTWPDVAALAAENPATTAFLERYRRQHDREPDRRWVSYGDVSIHLRHAVVVAEDIDFFSHQGFAWDQIEQALEDARKEGEMPRGASTITQQLAKNLWLSPSRNPWRKVEEAILTRQLEKHLGKHRILEIYLNVVELGPGVFGAEAAARHYFQTTAGTLGPRQAAELAASLPRPSTWHPGCGRRGYQAHVERILGRMQKTDWVRRQV